MAMASVVGVFGLIIYLFVLLFPVALLVALQVWLCRKSVKLGLILPGISLALSLVMVLNVAAFTTMSGTNTVTIGGGADLVTASGDEVPAQEGDYIEATAQEGVPRGGQEKAGFPVRTLIAVGALFLIMNIPTAVFGGIWLHYKGRRDTLEDLKRMSIEDLE